MSLLCIFRPHKWKHIFNSEQGNSTYSQWIGIYQCSRCKEISQGMDREIEKGHPFIEDKPAAIYLYLQGSVDGENWIDIDETDEGVFPYIRRGSR